MGTKIGYGITIAAGLATILGWLERSQWVQAFPSWLHRIVSQPWFLSTAFALTLLAFVGTGLWKLRSLEPRLRAIEKRQETDTDETIRKLNSLETRVWEGVNKMFLQVRRPIEDKLAELETRITKLEPGALGFALRIQEAGEETYKVVSGGTIQEWTRKAIDDLPEPQRIKLFEQHPDLSEWWLGKPNS